MADFTNGSFDTDLSSWIAGKKPTDLSATWWYDPNQESFSNNDAVGTLTDKSGSGNNATQGTAGAKPTFKTGGQNGLPYLSYDGGDFLNISVGFAASAFTHVVVDNYISGAFPAFLAEYSGTSNGYLALGADNTSTMAISKTGLATSNSSLTVGGAHIHIYKSAGVSGGSVSVTCYKDGTVSGTTPSLTGLSTNTTSQLGASKGGTADFHTGYHYDQALFPSNFTDQNVGDICSYLGLKYALTLSGRGGNVTRDTATKYAGAASMKVVTTDATDVYELVNPGSTGSYTITGYAYTTGAEVTSADVVLFYDGSAQSTTFTDMTGGWYKMTCNVTGAAANKKIGAQVKASKTVYLDSFSLTANATGGYMTTNSKFW